MVGASKVQGGSEDPSGGVPDPTPRLLQPILDLFLRVLAGMSLLVALTAAVLGPTRTLLAAAANAVWNLLLLWRLRRGHAEGVAFLAALGLLVVSLHAIARGSGIHDIGMVVVAVLMMLSALLERRWQALVIVVLTVAGVWLVGAAKVTGWASFDRGVAPRWDDVVVVTILLIAAAILMRAVMSRLRLGLLELEQARERRRRLEQELQHAERLRALGQLVSGVAHDFNNQLTAILAGADFVAREVRGNPAALQYVEEIAAAAHRSADLTRQLLATARRAEPRRLPLDLGALVEEVTTLLRRTLLGNIQVLTRLGPGPFTTVGDPSLLHSALLNLGVNARDAMPGGGTITVGLERRSLEVEEAVDLHLAPGTYLELSVVDSGTGMDEATLARIFDPFFTTKARGTGLGLAAAYGTLRAHGGQLTASSRPGQGSCFRMLLPVGEAPPEAIELHQSRSLSVLVVDADAVVCDSTARVLVGLGHRPLVSAPDQALARFGTQGDVQLVILDRAAMHPNGTDLLARLRAVAPGVPILLLAGYGEPDAIPVGRTRGLAVLSKPFGQKELASAIAELAPEVITTPTPPAEPPRTARPG